MSNNQLVKTASLIVLTAVFVFIDCASGQQTKRTPTSAADIEALVDQLRLYPWIGPENHTSPISWEFNFTDPMRKIPPELLREMASALSPDDAAEMAIPSYLHPRLAMRAMAWWRVELLAKPGVMVALLGVVLLVHPADPAQRVWFAVAVVFCLAGDVLLIFDDRFFVAGLAAFLVGHLCYVGGFLARGLQAPWAIGGCWRIDG